MNLKKKGKIFFTIYSQIENITWQTDMNKEKATKM